MQNYFVSTAKFIYHLPIIRIGILGGYIEGMLGAITVRQHDEEVQIRTSLF